MITKEQVFEILKPIVDPEIQLGLVELGLIYDISIENEGKRLEVKMTLTTPMCPYGPMLVGQVQDILSCLPGIAEARVTLVWEPPWDPRVMASDEAKDVLGIW